VPSESEDADATKGCREAPDVVWIPGGDEGGVELQGGRNDECVDGVSGGELQPREHMARVLSHRSSKLRYPHAGIVQQMIDGGIVSHATADFGENGSRNSDKGALVVSNAQDRRGTLGLVSANVPAIIVAFVLCSLGTGVPGCAGSPGSAQLPSSSRWQPAHQYAVRL